jgi:hypothetical protein
VFKGALGSLTGTASHRRRFRRELGLLVVAALGLLGRAAIELLCYLRLLLIARRKRRHPDQMPQIIALEQQLLDARRARWQSWRELTIRRRLAITATAAAIVFVAVQTAQSRNSSNLERATPATTAAPSPAAADTVLTVTAATPAAASAVDLEAAAQRFERATASASAGTWTYIAEAPVLIPGPLDQWDDFAIGHVSVLRDTDANPAGYRLWYRGCSLGVRGQRCAIGHAMSPDGIRWKKTSGPVFVPPEAAATAHLRALTVARANGRYFMWYSIAPSWLDGRKASTVHLATSMDGIAWHAGGQVFAGTEQTERHLDPSALWDSGQFQMWIVDSMQLLEKDTFKPTDDGPFLRHLTSADGLVWKESGDFPLGTLGIARVRPTVTVRPGGGYRAVLFDQAGIALIWIESDDGDAWAIASPPKAELSIPPPEEVETLDDATALDVAGGTLAWLVAGKDGKNAVRLGFMRR